MSFTAGTRLAESKRYLIELKLTIKLVGNFPYLNFIKNKLC